METKKTMLSGWCNTAEEINFAQSVLAAGGFKVELAVGFDTTAAYGEEAEIDRFFAACREARKNKN